METDAQTNTISRFAIGYEMVSCDLVSEHQAPCSYYYSPDEQGSTLYITDSQRQVINHYHYDAFGKILDSQEQFHNRITYVGQQYDAITEQYYLRARYYNPIIGRFTQEDIYRGDGLNLYAYCGNNPISYYDPSGYNRVVAFDLEDLHYDDINKLDFNSILKDYIGNPPSNMVDPHAHHIVFKLGRGKRQQKLVKELQEILYKDYGINPITGKEVLGWAPNRGTKGQHSYRTLKSLADDIKQVKKTGGTYKDIVEVLNHHKEIASKRKSTYKAKEKSVRVCKK